MESEGRGAIRQNQIKQRLSVDFENNLIEAIGKNLQLYAKVEYGKVNH